MRLFAPRPNNPNLICFRLPSTSTGLSQGRCWNNNSPGRALKLVSTSLKKFPVGRGQGLLKIAPEMLKDSRFDPNEGHRSIKAPACPVNTLTVKQTPSTAGPGPPPARIHNLLTEPEQAEPHL
ncbi:hypothetical protein DPX16_11133 [Anabarilius grahami]|uniref:Uncharacterized protein n=1 Tax=Anabarilius grahami TaxID=495550 RepID=A0A3N0Y2A7_ANAGA|nr:hypothetical protein DPX16_11133 [Anabarilius grahami]